MFLLQYRRLGLFLIFLGLGILAWSLRPLPPAAPIRAVSDEMIMAAIAQVESGGNNRARGRAGELSQYQFTAATWHECSVLPFAAAKTNPAAARQAALVNLARLRVLCLRHDIEPTPYLLALAWRNENATVPDFRPTAAEADQAARVVNLMESEVKP